MIDYLAIVVTMVVVIWLTQRFKLVSHCKEVMATARQANAIAANPALSDLDKETQTQQMAKKLLSQFVLVFTASVGAFVLPIVPLYGLSLINVINLDHVFSIMVSIEFIVVFSVIAIASLFMMNRS